MSIQNANESVAPMTVDDLDAQIAKLGASSEPAADPEAQAEETQAADPPEAGVTPDAGTESKQEGAGEVESDSAKADKKLVPLSALQEERRAKHIFKAQVQELQAQIEALKKGGETSDTAELDEDLLSTLEGEGPEFERLVTQVRTLKEKAAAAKPQGKAGPTVEDLADQSLALEDALESVPWIKGILAKGGALADRAIELDKVMPATHATLAERYLAVANALREEIGMDPLPAKANTPKAATSAKPKVAIVEEIESDPTTLSDLPAGTSGKGESERFMAMSAQQQQAHLARLSPDEQSALLDRVLLKS